MGYNGFFFIVLLVMDKQRFHSHNTSVLIIIFVDKIFVLSPFAYGVRYLSSIGYSSFVVEV